MAAGTTRRHGAGASAAPCHFCSASHAGTRAGVSPRAHSRETIAATRLATSKRTLPSPSPSPSPMATKRVGLLVGREWSFPPAFIQEVKKRDAGVVAEFVKIG